jgi:hypothetical protein
MDISEVPLLIAGVLVLFAAVFFVARNEVVKRRLKCPRTGEDADVWVKRRVEGARKPLRIKSCSLLDDPTHVDCGQDCIKEERRREPAGA